MARYTKRGRDGKTYATGPATTCWGNRPMDERAFCTGCHGAKDNRDVDRSKCGPLAIIDRLAAYEDTGLTPEEVADLQRAWDMYGGEEGITALLATPPNAPLTLEELREMPLLEWLWVEVIRPTKRQQFRNIKSAYYQIFEDYTDGEALCCGWPGVIHEFEYEDYGKTWLAYRRKPEEGAT